jgi:molecular chaperone HtpG
MKLAATSNDDFFNCIYRFISFETNYGTVPLGQLLDQQHPIKYVTDIDEFRKIAGVAFNQSFQLVNAGYVYEAAFFDKLNELYPQYNTTHFDSEELMLELTEISLDERDQIFDFLHHANLVLQDYKCHADVRKFQPVTMPAIYFKNDEMNYLRNIEKSREVADDIWGGILDNMTSSIANNAAATLCFNFNNPVVLKLTKLANKDVTTVLIKVLYVQTLLMGRHALQSKELSVLTNGLGYLIENIVDNNG